jgi:hypothetical protein
LVREWWVVDGTVTGVSQLALYEYRPALGMRPLWGDLSQRTGLVCDRSVGSGLFGAVFGSLFGVRIGDGIYINSSPSSLPTSTSTTPSFSMSS